MGFDRVLSADGDYVQDGKGGWKTTNTIAPAVRHQALDERGNWAGDPGAGSDLHTFRRAKDTDATAGRAAEALRASLQVFVDQGRAADLSVEGTRDQRSKRALSASLRDVQTGDEVALTTQLPWGV